MKDNINVEVIKAGKTGLFCNYIFKAIPLAFDESISYYECLCGLLNYLKNTIIPSVNNNADAVIELQNLYIQLEEYVNNYFDNLDVQEEINNKLDAMVEDGSLQQIISEYLNSKAVFGYDTIADMKEATNLINGSYARTMGYYSINDGGSGLYKIRNITNEDVVDNGSIIAMNNQELVAELIILNNRINIKQFGAYGDGNNDDHDAIIKSLDFLNKSTISDGEANVSTSTYVLEFNKGIYLNNSKIIFDKYIDNLIIKGNGSYIIGNGFRFSTKIGDYVNIDSLNFKNIDKCYEFDYINRNYQTMIFTNSTFRNCNNVFVINRRSCMVKFENCRFSGMDKAMLLNNVDKVEINNCWFQTSANNVDNYSSVIEQTGNDEGWIDVHDSFFIPQLQGDYLSWFKINKKLTFHENRASGENPNRLSLVYTSSDMDNADINNQKYIIDIYNNPIIDCRNILILNGIPNMINISNNGGYKGLSNPMIIWDPNINYENQNTKLQAKISNFNIHLFGNSFREFDKYTGDINVPASVKPIVPENILSFIQRSYRSIDNQVQNRIISKTMNGTNLTELKIQLYDLTNYIKRNNSGLNFLFAYKGYAGGSTNASYVLDCISLNQNGSTSNLKIDIKTLIGSRNSTEDYNITFEDGNTSVDTTQTPNPIIVITPKSNRFLNYPQFSELQLNDMLTLGQF